MLLVLAINIGELWEGGGGGLDSCQFSDEKQVADGQGSL